MRCFLMLTALLFAGSAGAQQTPSVEQLFIIPPQGWTIAYHDTKGATDLTEMLPPGQTLANWTEMLTIELIAGKPSMDAQALLIARLNSIHEGCDDVGAGPAQISVENGYDVAMRAIGCAKTKRYGKGEMSLFKVILGKNRSYVIGRAWSGEPFTKDKTPVPEKTMQDWLSFMSKVLVCDTGDRLHPCPTAN